MAEKIEAPVTGTEIDPTDPVGSLKSLLYGGFGVAIMFTVVAMGKWMYNNLIAQNTPDEVGEVEVL